VAMRLGRLEYRVYAGLNSLVFRVETVLSRCAIMNRLKAELQTLHCRLAGSHGGEYHNGGRARWCARSNSGNDDYLSKGPVVRDLIEEIKAFNRERDWEQYHSPKNLSMALSVEVAELLEVFQWLTENESRRLPPAKKQAVEEEIGDVTILLLALAEEVGVDILAAARKKLERNRAKYPVEKSRGRAEKYNELGQ
jgi:dCTP diphosphatase